MNGGKTVCDYPFLASRRGVWREIVRYVRRDSGHVERLLELGAGYCDFINQFPARRRICFEQNRKRRQYAAEGIDFRCDDAVALPGIAENSIQLVFASNFLEHLDADQLHQLLPRIVAVLQPGGRLVLLQPNHSRCAEHYFDDPTHKTIFSDQNITPFLEKFGLQVRKLVPGLLPFSMKSRLPKWPFLVRCYLALPWRPGAAQMYVVAVKE